MHGYQTHLRRAAGDLQHQFRAGRLLELLAFADRHDERTGAADHAILVVDIEVVDIHGEGVRPLQHNRQAVDRHPGREHVVAREGDERAAIVGAVPGNVDDAAKTAVAAAVEQGFGKAQRA